MTDSTYRRRNLRLPTYDYATTGSYFVTICVQNRACVLGEVVDGKVCCSPIGEMIDTHLHLAADRYAGIELDSYIIMPNHLHAVLNVGWSVAPEQETPPGPDGRHGGLHLRGEAATARPYQPQTSMTRVIQWFKSATTNEYIRRVQTDGLPRCPGKFWQPNYYEHVVRDHRDLDRVRGYIAANPGNWESDAEYSHACQGFIA